MQKTIIQATANSDHIEYGTAEIRSFSPQTVLAKSLQKLFTFWGIAILSIFLPVVHFVLVPLFFVLGIFFAIHARKFKHEIISGQVHCPSCKHEVKIGRVSFFESHAEICQNCACVMKISPS